MIHFAQGNLLETDAEAVVNTVNEVGVMGKGIALMFKEAFPDNYSRYREAAKRGEIQVGRMFVTRNVSLLGPRWIINFPTKRHWRQPSRLEWIRQGLRDLVRVIRESGIKSIALPPLGCGNGGLDWTGVRREMEVALGELDAVRILVFQPTATDHTEAKREGVIELTPARALIVELVRRYSVLGSTAPSSRSRNWPGSCSAGSSTKGCPIPLLAGAGLRADLMKGSGVGIW